MLRKHLKPAFLQIYSFLQIYRIALNKIKNIENGQIFYNEFKPDLSLCVDYEIYVIYKMRKSIIFLLCILNCICIESKYPLHSQSNHPLFVKEKKIFYPEQM
jgi:hypothetical protein